MGRVCYSVAPWLGKFGSIDSRNVGTTSCKNVETQTKKQPFMLQITASHRSVKYNTHLPPSSHSKLFLQVYIASNFDKGWRGDHKHKIMDRPLIPKYGTVSQVLLQLVVVSVIWPSTEEFIAETTCMKRSHAFSTLITQGLMGRLQKLRHVTSPLLR